MDSNSLPSPALARTHSRPSERRKNLRFDIRFPVFLRVLGEPWSYSETTEVSVTGASFVIRRPLLLNTPVEYVLTLPPELTKAQRPIRLRFYGSILRCERIAEGEGTFAVAVHNTSHRYLTPNEAAVFDELEPPG
jgi:PilZ domain